MALLQLHVAFLLARPASVLGLRLGKTSRKNSNWPTNRSYCTTAGGFGKPGLMQALKPSSWASVMLALPCSKAAKPSTPTARLKHSRSVAVMPASSCGTETTRGSSTGCPELGCTERSPELLGGTSALGPSASTRTNATRTAALARTMVRLDSMPIPTPPG